MTTTTWNKSLILLSIVVAIVAIYILSPVLTPFLISAILAYLGNPLVNKLTKLNIPRLVSVIIIFIGLFLMITLIFLILIPLIQKQIEEFVRILPDISNWFQNSLSSFSNYFSIEGLNVENFKQTLTDNFLKANAVAAWLARNVLASGYALIQWSINLILIPVVTFYLLRDWNILLANIKDLLPRSIEPTIVKLASECNEVLGAFLKGQFLVMICLGIIYAIGLTLIGLKIGVIIGLVAGLLSIVPYLGFIVGLGTSLIAALVQYGTLWSITLVLIVFLIGQALEGMILTPLLVGNRVGLHPVAVIFAIMAGGSLFGFFGILLAVPMASVIMVLLCDISRRYHKSQFYKTT